MNIIGNKVNKIHYNISSAAVNIELGRAPDVDRCGLVKRVIHVADRMLSFLSRGYRECRKQIYDSRVVVMSLDDDETFEGVEDIDIECLDLSLEDWKQVEGGQEDNMLDFREENIGFSGEDEVEVRVDDDDFLGAIDPDIFKDGLEIEENKFVVDSVVEEEGGQQDDKVVVSSESLVVNEPLGEEEEVLSSDEEEVVGGECSGSSRRLFLVAASVVSVCAVVWLASKLLPDVEMVGFGNPSAYDTGFYTYQNCLEKELPRLLGWVGNCCFLSDYNCFQIIKSNFTG